MIQILPVCPPLLKILAVYWNFISNIFMSLALKFLPSLWFCAHCINHPLALIARFSEQMHVGTVWIGCDDYLW